MSIITSSTGIMSVQPAQTITTGSAQSPLGNTQPDDAGSVKISMAGLMMAGQANKKTSGKYDDIENSGLPDEVQRILKMIRDLKEKLKAEQEKLQQIMNDASLSDETRQVKVAQSQAMINALSGALADANQMLAKVTKDLNLSKEDLVKVAALAIK